MNSLKNRSAEVEQEPTAQANRPDISKSSAEQDGVSESGVSGKTHSFSKRVAEHKIGTKQKNGWAGALVLKFLSHLQRGHGKTIDGKKWVRINLDNLAAQYPYLGRSGVDKAIQRLKSAGACLMENHNPALGRPKYDRTCCYHTPKRWMDLAEEEIRYFDSALATELGVPAAVIHYNCAFWMSKLRSDGEAPIVELAPAGLATRLPFSKPTIKRGLKDLAKAGYIYPVDGQRCHYSDQPTEGSKVDKDGSKVDNDSIVSIIIGSLEDSSKRQSSTAFENFVSAEEMEVTQAHSHEAFVPPDTDEQDTAKPVMAISPFAKVHQPTQASFPDISNFAELHESNRLNATLLADCAHIPRRDEKLVTLIDGICESFFHPLDKEWLNQLYEDASDEEVFDALLPIYRDWFVHACIEESAALFKIAYYGAFECILGAFLTPRHGEKNRHPISSLIRVAYALSLTFMSRSEERRERAVENEFAERTIKFRSIDEHLERCPDLAPAQKARVFKQGLYSMNKVGWPCLGGTLCTNGIIITSKAIKGVEDLFAANEELTPKELLDIMKTCVALNAHMPPVPEKFKPGSLWHARMGNHHAIFVSHLDCILRQLNIDCPSLTSINDDANALNDESEHDETIAA